MSEKDFVAGMNSDARKAPVRVAFVTRRVSAAVRVKDEERVMTFPDAFLRILVAVEVMAFALVMIALLFDAPLEGLADPLHTPNPAKAPWYFLGLQEMVSYSAFWGGIGIPGLLVAAAVVAPFLERKKGGEG